MMSNCLCIQSLTLLHKINILFYICNKKFLLNSLLKVPALSQLFLIFSNGNTEFSKNVFLFQPIIILFLPEKAGGTFWRQPASVVWQL